jgi:hypothetical protein
MSDWILIGNCSLNMYSNLIYGNRVLAHWKVISLSFNKSLTIEVVINNNEAAHQTSTWCSGRNKEGRTAPIPALTDAARHARISRLSRGERCQLHHCCLPRIKNLSAFEQRPTNRALYNVAFLSSTARDTGGCIHPFRNSSRQPGSFQYGINNITQPALPSRGPPQTLIT